VKKRKPKKVSKNKWLDLKETSQYEFDLFHDIAYVFYLLDIYPYMLYTSMYCIPTKLRKIDEVIMDYSDGVYYGKKATR
jgi:hypothetical protein